MEQWGEVITSRQNPAVVRAAKLRQKKYRDAEGVFLADGWKLFFEAAETGLDLHRIYLSAEAAVRPPDGARPVLERFRNRVLLLSEGCFAKISEEKAPQGVICEIKTLDKWKHFTTIYDMDFSPDKGILLTDNLQDPGNLGTILRSAAAFGVGRVILGGACADPTGAKTLRAAMGAAFKLAIDHVPDTALAVSALRRAGRRVYATELRPDAVQLPRLSLDRSDVFLIGNEGNGISSALSALCTGSVFIPMTGQTESLNAAVAASVCLWQQYSTTRQ